MPPERARSTGGGVFHPDQAAGGWPAITSHSQGNHAVRIERWRYIHYADGSKELYDMQNDPQ